MSITTIFRQLEDLQVAWLSRVAVEDPLGFIIDAGCVRKNVYFVMPLC